MPLSSTWSSFAWRAGVISPTSSSSSVPRSASAKSPGRPLVAPVNAPFTCPKSSLSSSVSGSDAQLTATNGPLARTLVAWLARARAVLPVPVSPTRSTGVEASATRLATSKTSRMAGLAATRVPRPTRSLSVARRDLASRRTRASSRARSRKSASSSIENGLVM